MIIGGKTLYRRATMAGVVSLLTVLSPAHAATAAGDVDPRLRYQLLTIAAEASRVCAWADQDFRAHLLQRRERLAKQLIAREVTNANELAVIRKRGRRIFRAEGCQSPAISDLMATVSSIEIE